MVVLLEVNSPRTICDIIGLRIIVDVVPLILSVIKGSHR
jgi:hypothetical protein